MMDALDAGAEDIIQEKIILKLSHLIKILIL